MYTSPDPRDLCLLTHAVDRLGSDSRLPSKRGGHQHVGVVLMRQQARLGSALTRQKFGRMAPHINRNHMYGHVSPHINSNFIPEETGTPSAAWVCTAAEHTAVGVRPKVWSYWPPPCSPGLSGRGRSSLASPCGDNEGGGGNEGQRGRWMGGLGFRVKGGWGFRGDGGFRVRGGLRV